MLCNFQLENILIGPDGLVKLVDFGSATMEKIYPTPEWSMNKRTLVEEQIAQKTTPMYRAPEMLDLWSNYPIDEHSDMWALGCLLFALNFGQHPFQDSNKLAITNANYNLPKNVSESNPVVSVIRKCNFELVNSLYQNKKCMDAIFDFVVLQVDF